MICPVQQEQKIALALTNRVVVCRKCRRIALLWTNGEAYFFYTLMGGFVALDEASKGDALSREDSTDLARRIKESGLPKEMVDGMSYVSCRHRDITRQSTTDEMRALRMMRFKRQKV